MTLTFDNGPDPEATPFVLDVLRRAGLRSTFFVVGSRLEQGGRALAQRARAEGHLVGNHTYSHYVQFDRADDDGLAEREIGRTERLIGNLAQASPLFRPFGRGGVLGPGLLNEAAVEHLRRHAYTCVLWNAIPRDWDDPEGWAQRALDQCAARDWSLMVLHDMPTGAMRHLEAFIDRARTAGVDFRQDFPPDCVPILRGKVVRPIDAYLPTGQ